MVGGLFLLKLRTSSHEALKYEDKSWVAVFSHPTCISAAEEPWAPASPEPPTPTRAHGTSRPEGPAYQPRACLILCLGVQAMKTPAGAYRRPAFCTTLGPFK